MEFKFYKDIDFLCRYLGCNNVSLQVDIPLAKTLKDPTKVYSVWCCLHGNRHSKTKSFMKMFTFDGSIAPIPRESLIEMKAEIEKEKRERNKSLKAKILNLKPVRKSNEA